MEPQAADEESPSVVPSKRQRNGDEEEGAFIASDESMFTYGYFVDKVASAFKKSRTAYSRGVWQSMVARMSDEDRARWAKQRWMRKMGRKFGVRMN